MTSLECKNCYHFGPEEDFEGDGIYECPECKSRNVDYARACDTCDTFPAMDHGDDCAMCVHNDRFAHDKIYDDEDYVLAAKEVAEHPGRFRHQHLISYGAE